ncbi:MAG: hypothetical protein SGPRY_013023 [Prymnesium sp.]
MNAIPFNSPNGSLWFIDGTGRVGFRMLARMDETSRATPTSTEEAGSSADHAAGETPREGGRTADPTLAQEQRKGFERALDDLCAERKGEERSQFLTKEKNPEILEYLLGWDSMGNSSERKAKYSQGYAWIKKYTVLKSGGLHLVVCIDPDALEQRKLKRKQGDASVLSRAPPPTIPHLPQRTCAPTSLPVSDVHVVC